MTNCPKKDLCPLLPIEGTSITFDPRLICCSILASNADKNLIKPQLFFTCAKEKQNVRHFTLSSKHIEGLQTIKRSFAQATVCGDTSNSPKMVGVSFCALQQAEVGQSGARGICPKIRCSRHKCAICGQVQTQRSSFATRLGPKIVVFERGSMLK